VGSGTKGTSVCGDEACDAVSMGTLMGLPFVATKHVMQFLWARSSQTEENNVALERERERTLPPTSDIFAVDPNLP